MGRKAVLLGVLAVVAAGGVAVIALRPGTPEKSEKPENTPIPTPTPPPVLGRWREAVLTNPRSCIGLEMELRQDEEGHRTALRELARQDGNPRVRAFTVSVLGRFKAPPEEAFFIACLGDEHEFPRASAIDALGRIGTGACLDALRKVAAGDPVDALRAAAARAVKAVESRK